MDSRNTPRRRPTKRRAGSNTSQRGANEARIGASRGTSARNAGMPNSRPAVGAGGMPNSRPAVGAGGVPSSRPAAGTGGMPNSRPAVGTGGRGSGPSSSRYSTKRSRSKIPFIIGGVAAVLLLLFIVPNVFGIIMGSGNQADGQGQQADETLATSDPDQPPITLTISFAGDCTLGTDVNFNQSTSLNAKYDEVGDPAYFMQNVADIFAADDYTVVNMEGTLTDATTRQDKQFAFKGPAEYVSILTEGNIEAATVANNHSHDYGEQSFQDTIATLDEAGIVNFGYERIAYVDVKGVKVALIGTYMLAKGLGIQDEMVSNINTARDEGAQLVIVYAHWGVERETVPTAEQMQLGHIAIDAGADLVVGTHPHVIQGYEKYNGRYIVYSLGNFCFGGNKNPADKDCMIFQQTFTVTGNEVATDDAINIIPCSISSVSDRNNYQPTPAEGSEAERIMEKINESSAIIASCSSQV